MGAAYIGLIGALLGAITALAGSILSVRMQARHERTRWVRDRRQAAYDGAVRYLLRALNRRSKISVSGGRIVSVIAEEHVRETFDDLVEAQFWFRALTAACGDRQLERIRQAADDLDARIASLSGVGASQMPNQLGQELSETLRILTECAREDLKDDGTAGRRRLTAS
ncbi:hypothetical protein ACFY91_24660 [Streptomyces albogriseolus]|uniref:hypothetical protein n=1 Tax=Streptomyces albogriseolus TaxID=1887 RepID=UPI0036EF0FC8